MVSSITQPNVSGIEAPQQELAEWQTLQKQQNNLAKFNNKASVVLNGLLFNYSKINPNALSNNKIRVVNGKYDDKYSNGVWQNPYDSKQTFAMVAPILTISKSNVEARLPTTLWHTNTSVTNIDVDFGNNTGYKSLHNGSVATTNYTAIGNYTWTYRVQLANGQYKYCRQKIRVTAVDTNAQARNPACPIQIEPITATKPYLGLFGSATLQIAYGSNNCTLQNPLIVAEGLDTGLLAQAGNIGDSDYNSFRFSVLESQSIDLQNLISNNTAIDYDIVYVNWDNGIDFIQRNAFVLEAVIDWVNANKVGNAQNVVLGQSMGGLIARYALKDMEDNAESHDTSLYISHDAPHQGAHVPPGILHMGRDVANQFLQTPLGNINVPLNGTGNFGLATVDDLLDAPAVNQMLISSVDTNGTRTSIFNNAWQSELENMGYPQLTRNIALSNASHCASSQGLPSNQSYVEIAGNGGSSDLTSLITFAFGAGALVGDFFNDTSTFLLGFLPGNDKLDVDFRAKAFSSFGLAQIYKGRLTYEKTLLWVAPITRTIFDNSVNSQLGDTFIDNYPGGINPNAIAISNSNYEENFLFNYGFNFNLLLNFDFIPATSALDVGSGLVDLNDADYYRQYTAANPPTGNKAIPFDNFTTSSNQNNSLNEEHISFNRRNGDWLAEELDADTDVDIFDCTLFCDSNTISGSDLICTSEDYSLGDTTTTTIWTLEPANAGTITVNNNTTITIDKAFGFNGDAILIAEISSPRCGTMTFTKDLHFGVPSGTASISGDTDLNPGLGDSATFNVNAANVSGYTSTDWVVYNYNIPNASLYFTLQPSGNGNTVTIVANNNTPEGDYYIQVRLTNDCGFFSVDKSFYVNEGSGNTQIFQRGSNYSVYPNPSHDLVNIQVKDDTIADEKDIDSTGELFDIYGRSRLIVTIKNNKGVFSVRPLETGVYILKLYLNSGIESHQVLVK